MSKKLFLLSFLALFLIVGTASASHSWGNYHWGRIANPFTLELGSNVSAKWDSHLAVAASDWSLSSVLDTVVAKGSTKPRNCKAKDGRVEVCSTKYGNTGWLGRSGLKRRLEMNIWIIFPPLPRVFPAVYSTVQS